MKRRREGNKDKMRQVLIPNNEIYSACFLLIFSSFLFVTFLLVSFLFPLSFLFSSLHDPCSEDFTVRHQSRQLRAKRTQFPLCFLSFNTVFDFSNAFQRRSKWNRDGKVSLSLVQKFLTTSVSGNEWISVSRSLMTSSAVMFVRNEIDSCLIQEWNLVPWSFVCSSLCRYCWFSYPFLDVILLSVLVLHSLSTDCVCQWLPGTLCLPRDSSACSLCGMNIHLFLDSQWRQPL